LTKFYYIADRIRDSESSVFPLEPNKRTYTYILT